MKNPYARLLSLSTVLALILSLAATTIARADDPPPPPVTEETVVDPPQEETPPASVLEILPENTTLVVLVEEQVVPLGSVTATNAILVGDPIWCPEGAAPTPSINGCTASYPNLESLIDDFDTSTLPEPNQHGTIWILSGADSSSVDLVIDGAVFTAWSNFRLTLHGGWDGTSAGTLSGSSSFSVPISIYNWNNQVAVSNITVQNANATGLEIESTGDIVFENVTASDNQGYGVELYADGNITLNGSNTFDGNAASGVYAEAGGNLTANNMTADGNGGVGAELYASGDIHLGGDNSFSGNADTGLYAEAGGDLHAENLDASNNTGAGAELLASSHITLTGDNAFNANSDSGVIVDAGADAALENVEAFGNGEYGAEVYAQGTVTLGGGNLFENSAFGGLLDAGGNIFIGNLSAHENGGYGAELYTPENVSIGNASVNDNDYSGLYIEAGGDIALENITASGNGHGGAYGSGIEAYTLGRFNLTGVNTFNNNYFEGLYIDAIGNVFILNVFAEANGTSGVYIETAGNARIECSTFTNNTGPEIEADLSGILTLAGVDFGGDLDNEVAVDEDHLVLVSNACFTYPADEEEDNNQGSSLPDTSAITLRPIHQVTGNEPVELDCDLYQGTLIILENGDGAYIPCPIEDTAQLVDLANVTLPGELPGTYTFLSGFLLTILKEGQSLGPLNQPNAIWYASTDQIRNSTVQAVYWNGADWVELTDQITPFMRLFFEIPAELKGSNFAILYWDGTAWVEVQGPAHLGNGYLIREGGHVSADGSLFEATLNFTGTFVLVKK